jgi:hypothetical protein
VINEVTFRAYGSDHVQNLKYWVICPQKSSVAWLQGIFSACINFMGQKSGKITALAHELAMLFYEENSCS